MKNSESKNNLKKESNDMAKKMSTFKNHKKISPKVKRNRILAISIIVLIFAGILINRAFKEYNIRKTIQLNLEVLKAMELKNVGEIESKLKELRDKYGIGKINIDSISNKRFFEDSLFMGDSLTEPLSLYGHLPKSNVLAVKGRNAKTALEDIKEIKNLNPSRIFLSYGMNDLNTTSNGEDFKKNYGHLISEIKKIKPDAKITVLSILYANSSAVSSQPTLRKERVDEYNDKIAELCKENNYNFLDVRSILNEGNLYEEDGIHLVTGYYTKLLNFIKTDFINRR